MKKTFDSCTLFKRVLLVQDNPKTIAEIHDILDLHFFEVTPVTNAPAAIQQLLKSDFDVIVCDFTSPDMPAEMFLQALARIRPKLLDRLVAINDAATNKNVRNSCTVSIWKPIEPRILLEAIEKVLKKSDTHQRANTHYAAA